ncbi:RcpC/CpaB family pilus assembly protein [Streptomyces ziwulingensis]|uniref:Flp pilus assembly protein RcpC/CpaB domain-containing protein n=1 Tax=Streptomyces ziwulingensis TaxID=1045501 RepID=A0ABP9D172_9ACTN
MPQFAPVRVRGGHRQSHRLVRHRRRAVAAGLAVTAAALVAAGPYPGTDARDGGRDGDRARGRPLAAQVPKRLAPERVAAPVRIADAETVRLLRPGDRVDVIATGGGGTGGHASGDGGASVVARGARVTEIPEVPDASAGQGGALVVLSVPRPVAARLVGAAALSRLAVTLC